MNIRINSIIILLVVLSQVVCSQTSNNAQKYYSKGSYFGQKLPGITPIIFAPDFISTDKNEVNSVFTPDGKEFYFSRFDPGKGYTIMVTKEYSSGWSQPEVAPFSGSYSEVDMFISPDGKKLFYLSKRPIKDSGPSPRGYQIWVMERKGTDWVNPKHLGDKINFGKRQLYPSVTNDGTIYFNSDINGFGKGDFFKSKFIDGNYEDPVNIGSVINSEYDETDPLIAPDESFLIFTSVNRPDGFGSGDLYISFRNKNNSWGIPKNMGSAINTSSSEFAPILSPDGKYLAFLTRLDEEIGIWELDKDEIVSLKLGVGVNSVTFSPDGKMILTGNRDNTARLWSLDAIMHKKFVGHTGEVYAAVFSPGGEYIVTAGLDKTVRLWDSSKGKEIKTFPVQNESVYSAMFSRDGQKIVTAGKDGTARLWDLDGIQDVVFEGHGGEVRSAMFSPDGKYIITASNDKTARLWDLNGNPVFEFKTFDEIIHTASFSPDGKYVLIAPAKGPAQLRLINPETIIEKIDEQKVPPLTGDEKRNFNIID